MQEKDAIQIQLTTQSLLLLRTCFLLNSFSFCTDSFKMREFTHLLQVSSV